MRSDRRDGFGIGIEFVESAFPGIGFDCRGDGLDYEMLDRTC